MREGSELFITLYLQYFSDAYHCQFVQYNLRVQQFYADWESTIGPRIGYGEEDFCC